jgi:hypothetical protein
LTLPPRASMISPVELQQQNDRPENERPAGSTKKPYSPPRLTEYGNVAKLTQGPGSLPCPDGQSNMVRLGQGV